MDNDLSVKFGTDLLSHPLVSGQYHRLWRAYPLVSGSEWEEVDTADIGCCHGPKTEKAVI